MRRLASIQQPGTHTIEARYLGDPGRWAGSSVTTTRQIDVASAGLHGVLAALVAAANAAGAKLGHAAEQVQAQVRRGNVNGACGNVRALLAQIVAEQKRGSIVAVHAAALTNLTRRVRDSLGCG